MLHNASLMIDDIEDNSKLRRGIPVAHAIFGTPTVINSANYAYFLALEKCHALKNPKAIDVFVGEMLNLHRGQGQDIMVCVCVISCHFKIHCHSFRYLIKKIIISGEMMSHVLRKSNI
jgi:geranylgeranyl pyrophosphate synthase